MSFELVGNTLAISGSLISIGGTLVNNLQLKHHLAMKLWAISNPLLCIWALGVIFGIWNGGLSIMALLAMYLTFTITNFYGLYISERE